ncbi:probable WRKY transcription factor protein 1 [Chrysoperla carnea]|uniref:probable WRKY transcription factor protein 1 n=1 Tax=Chrysoperla carnea TaxID=189513 RepID=UPI001D080482|nr:probable WRKY transcription factor protein 1 [Chrysoperla carnea]
MNFDFTEHNLEKFYNDHYIERLKQKWKISLDTFHHLYPFQIRGIQFLLRNFLKNQSCILDYDPQMGKTVIISVLLDSIMCTNSQFHSIIICEQHLINHWYEHIIKWSNFEPICIKNSTDIEKIHLNDRIICIVDYEKVNEIKINTWNLIVVDNADKRSIINNRHVKKFKDNCKSSMFVLLTNAAVKQPSKRETLWYLLHFLNTEPAVPSLKKFTSESLYTLQDQLWFPWRDLYQRIGWYIYPEYKEIIKKNSNVIIKKQPPILHKIPINDITITADDTKLEKHELTTKSAEKNNSKINLLGNYFITVNNEFLTPRCIELRKLLKPNTKFEIVNENNNRVNNLETLNRNDRPGKINIDNTAKLNINSENNDRNEKRNNEFENNDNATKLINVQNYLLENSDNKTQTINFLNKLEKINQNDEFKNDFEQLIAFNKKPKINSQETKAVKSQSEKTNIDLPVESKGNNSKVYKELIILNKQIINKNYEFESNHNAEKKNNPLFRQSQIFINDDATKKIMKESVDKRINTTDYSNDRKKLKTHSSSNNFKSIELKSNEKDSKQKQVAEEVSIKKRNAQQDQL